MRCQPRYDERRLFYAECVSMNCVGNAALAFPLWGKVAPELAPVTDEGQ